MHRPTHRAICGGALAALVGGISACVSDSTGPVSNKLAMTVGNSVQVDQTKTASQNRLKGVKRKIRTKDKKVLTFDSDARFIEDEGGRRVMVRAEDLFKMELLFDLIASGDALVEAMEKSQSKKAPAATQFSGSLTTSLSLSASSHLFAPPANDRAVDPRRRFSTSTRAKLRPLLAPGIPKAPVSYLGWEDYAFNGLNCRDLSSRMMALSQQWTTLRDPLVGLIAQAVAAGVVIGIGYGYPEFSAAASAGAFMALGITQEFNTMRVLFELNITGAQMHQYNCIYGNDYSYLPLSGGGSYEVLPRNYSEGGGSGGTYNCYEAWRVWRDENGYVTHEEYMATICGDGYMMQ